MGSRNAPGFVKKFFIIIISFNLLLAISMITGIACGEGEYRLRAGDLLNIGVIGYPEFTMDVLVGADGMISTAFDPIAVEGLTLGEARKAITEAYAEYIRDPRVWVNVKEYRPGIVKVLGAVARPGIYTFPIYKAPTVSEAIAMAGDFSEKADSKMVYVMKGQGEAAAMVAINFNELLMSNNVGEYLLEDGDMVYVPERKGGVLVLGEVVKPGQYPLVKDMKVMDAIAQAGGTKPEAKLGGTTLSREVDGERRVMEIPLDKLLAMGSGEGNFELQDGDVIHVPRDTRLTVGDAVTIILSAVKLIKDLVTGW